jgi:hypothetical protein
MQVPSREHLLFLPSRKELLASQDDDEKSHTVSSRMNLMHFAKRVIARPVLRVGLHWHGLYAARRGSPTMLASTCNDRRIALMQLMGHKKLDVILAHYVRPVPANLAGAMKAMEAAVRTEDLTK